MARMSRRRLLWLPAALAMSGLAGCMTIAVHRFRLTVEIDTPDGVRRGDSVMQVRYRRDINFNGGGWQVHTDLDGEGVFVDLGDGRSVVAVFGQPLLRSLAWRRSFLPSVEGEPVGPVEIAREDTPAIATFERSSDPASARVVWGQSMSPATGEIDGWVDDFAAVFGAGYGLRRIFRESAPPGTPLTKRLATNFPWLTDPAVMTNPGWMRLPELARLVIRLMRSGEVR